MMKVTLATTMFLAAMTGNVSAQPSFDCTKASFPDEKAICGNPYLSRADQLISKAYRTYKPEYQPKLEVARKFLMDRRRCGSDEACIAAVQDTTLNTFALYEEQGVNGPWTATYAKALMAFKAAKVATSKTSPEHHPIDHPGQCVRTSIVEITTRFGDPVTFDNEDEGTAISYQNGIFTIAYDRAPYAEAKTGQEVVLCLMSIPYDCPEGDARGRLFYTLNTATYSDWIMSNAQHSCGGA